MPFAPRGDKPPYVKPSVEPIQPQIQPYPKAPPATPVKGDTGPQGPPGETGPAGPPGPAGQPAEIDYEKLAVMVAEKLATDPRCKGADGKPGSIDQENLVSTVIANIDQRIAVIVDAKIQQAPRQPTLDEIVAAVIEKMPPQPMYFDVRPKQ